jgi:hypothetical protein
LQDGEEERGVELPVGERQGVHVAVQVGVARAGVEPHVLVPAPV